MSLSNFNPGLMSRRGFLGLAGAAAGASTLPPAALAAKRGHLPGSLKLAASLESGRALRLPQGENSCGHRQ
jgi:hypothetical protein